MTGRPRILILSYSPLASGPRPLKQIALLSKQYDVTTAGYGAAPLESLRHIELVQSAPYSTSLISRLKYRLAFVLRMYRLASAWNLRDKAALELLSNQEWDIVIAHDVKTIYVANCLSAKHGVLADLHEYAPKQGDDVLAWRLLMAPYYRWLCRTEVVKAAAVTTVSLGIVGEYEREFGFTPELVANATPFHDLAPTPVSTPIRLVHSGSAVAARKIEVMIEAVRHTSADVTLDLYLVESNSAYFRRLKDLAGDSARIHFRDAVPYDELIPTLNQYDIGVSILPPTNFNHLWALPNKFFDYIQARLGVIIGPSPEMARIVREFSVGHISPDFSADSLARVLESITPDQVGEWKRASHGHARELSAGEQVKVWASIVERMLAGTYPSR